MYSLVDWKQLRKESLSLKMKTETNKTEKQREKEKKRTIYKNCGTSTNHKIFIQKIPKEKRGGKPKSNI